jgi:hypothetical protein
MAFRKKKPKFLLWKRAKLLTTLLSSLSDILKEKISFNSITAWRPQGRALQAFFGPNLPYGFRCLSVDRKQHQGLTGV